MERACLPALNVLGRVTRVIVSSAGPKTRRSVDTGNASSTEAHSTAPKVIGSEQETVGT